MYRQGVTNLPKNDKKYSDRKMTPSYTKNKKRQITTSLGKKNEPQLQNRGGGNNGKSNNR